MTTVTCRDCGLTGEPDGLTWVPSKRYVSGFDPRCRACYREHRRAEKKYREACMTDEQWREQRDRARASRREYAKANSDKLAAGRRAAKARAEVPGIIVELRKLYDARRARDLGPKWKEWRAHTEAALQEKYGYRLGDAIPPEGVNEHRNSAAYAKWQRDIYRPHLQARSAYSADPTIRLIRDVDATMADKAYFYGFGLDRRYDELRAKLEAFTAEELHACLVHVPAVREEAMPPSVRRTLVRLLRSWQARRDGETNEDRARREASMLALLSGDLTSESIRAQHKEDLKANDAGRPPVTVLETSDEADTWGGLGAEVAAKEQRAIALAEARRERNRRRRERRRQQRKAEAKEATRWAAKAESERRRRERLRNETMNS